MLARQISVGGAPWWPTLCGFCKEWALLSDSFHLASDLTRVPQVRNPEPGSCFAASSPDLFPSGFQLIPRCFVRTYCCQGESFVRLLASVKIRFYCQHIGRRGNVVAHRSIASRHFVTILASPDKASRRVAYPFLPPNDCGKVRRISKYGARESVIH